MRKATIKSKREIEKLREGGKILARALFEAGKLAKEGAEKKVSTMDLNDLAEKIIRESNGEPAFLNYGEKGNEFPASLCVSINNEVVHGIPKNDRFLKNSDLVKLDLGVKFKGMITDACISVLVGDVSDVAKRLVETTKRALEIGIEQIYPGSTLGNFGSAVDRYARKNGYGTVKKLVGHGVGYEVHEPPQIPNYGKAGEGMKIKEGMVLALEPMLNAGSDDVILAADDFTFITVDGKLSAQFEHTVAVTKNGCEILTELNN